MGLLPKYKVLVNNGFVGGDGVADRPLFNLANLLLMSHIAKCFIFNAIYLDSFV